jgi:hypothetical protein
MNWRRFFDGILISPARRAGRLAGAKTEAVGLNEGDSLMRGHYSTRRGRVQTASIIRDHSSLVRHPRQTSSSQSILVTGFDLPAYPPSLGNLMDFSSPSLLR